MARDPALVAFYAFTAAALGGWAVALGGFVALQAGCKANPEWMARQGAFAGTSCARWNAEDWFGLTYHLLALALAPLCYHLEHFKAARGAAWALLVSACMYNSVVCNLFLTTARASEAAAAPAAAAAGLALLVAGSFGVVGAGSALAHGARRAALGGVGAESKLWRAATLAPRALGRATSELFRSRERARAAAAASLALAAAGWAVALGGVAAVQAACTRDPAAMRAFRLFSYPYVSAGDNTIDCARAFAELWWAWALATATLAAAAGAAAARQMARFRAAGFALLISSTHDVQLFLVSSAAPLVGQSKHKTS
jgi:hypothetical protein